MSGHSTYTAAGRNLSWLKEKCRGSQNVKELLNVVKPIPHEQRDGRFDKKMLHSHVCQPFPTVQWDAGVGRIVSDGNSYSDDRVDVIHGKRRPFLKFQQARKIRRNETNSRSVPLQQVCNEESVSHAHEKAVCASR